MTYIMTLDADNGNKVTFDLSRCELKYCPQARDKYILTTGNGTKLELTDELYDKIYKRLYKTCETKPEECGKVDEDLLKKVCDECGNLFDNLYSYRGDSVCANCFDILIDGANSGDHE